MLSILRRELVHLGRDWTEYAIGAGYALFLLFVMGGLDLYFLGHLRSRSVARVSLPVQGLEHATPRLRQALEEQRIELRAHESLPAAVARGQEAWGLVIPPGLEQGERGGPPAQLAVLANTSVRSFIITRQVARERLKLALHNYRRATEIERRGWSEADPRARAVTLAVEDLAPAIRNRGLGALSFKLLLAFLVLVTGAYLVDMLPGETRHFTLEALLVTPAGAATIVFGKLLAGYVVTLVIVGAMVGAVWGGVMAMPDWMTAGTYLGLTSLVSVLLACLSLGYVMCALQLVLGALVTGYEAAQTTVAVVGGVLLIVGLVVSGQVEGGPGAYLVPIVGSFELLDAWLERQAVPWSAALASLASSLIVGSALAVVFARYGFDRERLLYGRAGRPSAEPVDEADGKSAEGKTAEGKTAEGKTGE